MNILRDFIAMLSEDPEAESSSMETFLQCHIRNFQYSSLEGSLYILLKTVTQA